MTDNEFDILMENQRVMLDKEHKVRLAEDKKRLKAIKAMKARKVVEAIEESKIERSYDFRAGAWA